MSGDILFEGTGPGGWHWVHMQRSPATEAALLADPHVPEAAAWALLEVDTLPRASQIDKGTLLILRGVNLVAGAEPEDMVSLRLWITQRRIVSTEIRRLSQTDQMIETFRKGEAPDSPGHFVMTLVESLRASAEPVLDALEDRVSAMEARAAAPDVRLGTAERRTLGALRQDGILLHRFIAPQGVALDGLTRHPPDWLHEPGALREEAEAFRRIALDLESLRQRAQLIAEEIAMSSGERTNDIMLTLSIVSVIFLPLTFLTGLLGVNLAGIPYATAPWAFWGFCALLVAATALATWLAMRLLR